MDEVKSVKMNVVFFYKSNWQNELLRLQRRNKFIVRFYPFRVAILQSKHVYPVAETRY